MAGEVGSIFVRVGANTAGFDSGMARVQGTLGAVSTRMQAVGARFQAAGATIVGAGAALTAGFAVPLAAIGLGSLKAASDFESSFAGVRKTVDATEDEFAALAQGFRDMAKEIPVSVDELNRIGEAAGQLGIKKENIVDFTRTVADLAVTTNLTVDEAASQFARFANIVQMPQKNFDRLGATVVALGNKTATTEAEIVAFGLRIAGAGKLVGLTEPQIMGLGAALSSVGIEAEAGGTAISTVMVNIEKNVRRGGEKLDLFAQTAGMSAADFKTAWETDAAGALVTFIEGLGDLSESGGDTFGVLDELGLSNIRVRDALLRASGAGDLMRESLELGTEAWKDNTALTDEATKRYDTFQSKLQIVKNRLRDVGITLGTALMPVVLRMVDQLQPMIDRIGQLAQRFRDLSPATQGFVLKALGIAAAVGPILLIVGKLVSGFGALVPLIGALLSPVGLVIAAIAALAVGFVYAYRNSERFREIVGQVVNFLRDTFAPVIDFAREKFAEIAEAISAHSDEIRETIDTAWNAVKAIFDKTWPIVSKMVQNAWEMIKITVDTALRFIGGLIRAVMAVIRGDWRTAWEGIKQMASAIWDGIKAIFAGMIANLKIVASAAWEAIKAVASAAWNGIKAMLSAIWDAIKGLAQTTWNAIKSAVETATNQTKTAVLAVWSTLKAAVVGIWNTLKSVAAAVWNRIKSAISSSVNAAKGVIGGFIGVIQSLIGWFEKAASIAEGAWSKVSGAIDAIKGAIGGGVPFIPGFQHGVRNFGGGLAMVGEGGPELVGLPRGSRVFPAGETRRMLSQASTPTPIPMPAMVRSAAPVVNVYVTLDGRQIAAASRTENIQHGRRNPTVMSGRGITA